MGLKMIKAQGGIFGWVSDSEPHCILASAGAAAASRSKMQ